MQDLRLAMLVNIKSVLGHRPTGSLNWPQANCRVR